MMAKLEEYDVSIEEIHHTQKLDAPSGTAITLAEDIIACGKKTGWQLSESKGDKINISALRIGNTPGTHTVSYKSIIDTIDIKHTAHSREGFALGAVLAAEWILGKKRCFFNERRALGQSISQKMEKEIILITGANGMLAKKLEKSLSFNYQVRFLSRSPKRENEYRWDIENEYIDPKSLFGVNHVIHLAGTSIGEKRWTKARKQSILSSRVNSAKLLLKAFIENHLVLKTFISASAVGYYGTKTTSTIYKENDPAGDDFLSQVCQAWEKVAFDFRAITQRVVIFRFGVIIDKQGGMLNKILPLARYRLNPVIGSGKQYLPWIAIDDLTEMIIYGLKTSQLEGIYNAVAPSHVTHREFNHILSEQLNRKNILPDLPAFVLRLVLGEMSVLVLEGSRVDSQKIQQKGFRFKYPYLSDALKKELSEK
ncbi:Epimerase family protein yfcH (modular protein) [Capnocytophaga canimorsus]|nr:Epimerase family protein yfcH (modular protein) [Capnocytophaga canimorsus]